MLAIYSKWTIITRKHTFKLFFYFYFFFYTWWRVFIFIHKQNFADVLQIPLDVRVVGFFFPLSCTLEIFLWYKIYTWPPPETRFSADLMTKKKKNHSLYLKIPILRAVRFLQPGVVNVQ